MNWYVQIGQEQRGPISGSELKQLALSGTVLESTPIRQGDSGSWSTAGKVKGLQFGSGEPPILAIRTCPFCAEEIHSEAIKCKHCGEFLNGSVPARQLGHQAPVSMKQIAESQRTLIIVLLIVFFMQVPVFLMGYGEPILGFLTQFLLIVLQGVATFRLANRCYGDGGIATLMTLFALVPIFGIIALLIVNGKASKILQEHGLTIGLFGVDKATMENLA